MGHRASFVVIRDGRASAWEDQWAALGAAYLFADGPEAAERALAGFAATDALLDGAFAEGGYLLDFDQRQAIVFGYPGGYEETGGELDDLDSLAELLGADALATLKEQAAAELPITREIDAALQQGPLPFLQAIAPLWKGWLLRWDDRGVDAFGEHLAGRGIRTIAVQPGAALKHAEPVSFQA